MARRGKKHDDHGPMHVDEKWVVPYADMKTLLLALFVMLFALSNIDVRKFAALAQSMAAAFSTDVMQGSQATTVTSGQITAPDVGNQAAGAGMVMTDYQTLRTSLNDFAISNAMDNQLEVSRSNEGIVIRIGGSLLFESGRAILETKATILLNRVISLVKPLPNRVRIEGHTDDVAPDGFLYRDNWQLSIARAKAVLDAMITAGVGPDRLSIEGLAQYQPLVPNASDTTRARNRRVDVVILYPDANATATATPAPSVLP